MNDEQLAVAKALGYNPNYPTDDNVEQSWRQLNAMIEQFVVSDNKRARLQLKLHTFINTYALDLAKTLTQKENENGNS